MNILTTQDVLSKLSNSESFKDSVIENLDFSNHQFNDFVDFSNAYFIGKVNFSGATFKKGANFYNVTFNKGVDFRGVKTEGEINLEKAELVTSYFDLDLITNKTFIFSNNAPFTVKLDKKGVNKDYIIRPSTKK